VQVDPIKPELKLPGTKRLKLKCDESLTNFAFKFELRRSVVGLRRPIPHARGRTVQVDPIKPTLKPTGT
jgi:hypothetical protein